MKKLTELISIENMEVYDFYDKPLCFICTLNGLPQLYFAYWTSEDDNYSEYVYFPISESELEELELGLLTRKEFFSTCYDRIMKVDTYRANKETVNATLLDRDFDGKYYLEDMTFDELFDFYSYSDHFPDDGTYLLD